MSDLMRKPVAQLTPEMLDVLDRLIQRTEADREADIADIQALSPEQIDAEWRAVGIDPDATVRRLQGTVKAGLERSVTPIAAGIQQIMRDAKECLVLTFEGLELLRKSYVPQTLRQSPARTALLKRVDDYRIPVVMLVVRPTGGNVKLILRWLRDAPQEPPSVTVRVGSQTQCPMIDWDWMPIPDRVQAVQIKSLILPDHASNPGDRPMIRYHWDAASNHLDIDLYPVD